MIKAVLAIDIGGTLTKIGLVTKEGRILAHQTFDTEASKPFDDFLDRLHSQVEQLKPEEEAEIVAIGVGAPNANPLNGIIEHPPNLDWGDYIPLLNAVHQRFNRPTVIANDANATAVGEMMYGVAKGMKNFVVLTLGTGLGSGIIVNGELLIGEHGVAGEIGHVSIDPEGRQCKCGLKGCLETYASVTGLKRTVFDLIAQMKGDSVLKRYSFHEMTGEIIAEAALAGDEIALEAFADAAERLGDSMANTVAHLDPEAIILTGGLSKAGDLLVRPVRESMERHLFTPYRNRVKVLISDSADVSSVHGPAALAWNALNGVAV
ncbi:MAG: ROK family protein [Flavobacteriales bacterium]|nr:ROK family protein [Flavobacteriales bacterium]